MKCDTNVEPPRRFSNLRLVHKVRLLLWAKTLAKQILDFLLPSMKCASDWVWRVSSASLTLEVFERRRRWQPGRQAEMPEIVANRLEQTSSFSLYSNFLQSARSDASQPQNRSSIIIKKIFTERFIYSASVRWAASPPLHIHKLHHVHAEAARPRKDGDPTGPNTKCGRRIYFMSECERDEDRFTVGEDVIMKLNRACKPKKNLHCGNMNWITFFFFFFK